MPRHTNFRNGCDNILREILEIEKNDCISITGSGGKTTLMLKLAKELGEYKTLIATTTKIFPPQENQYDYFYSGQGLRGLSAKKGITLAVKGETDDGKLVGYEPEILDSMVKLFDCAIIESDGAKMKYLKGWNDGEPVIISGTTKTVGVLNLKLLGAEINPENIHRPSIYMKNFCEEGDGYVDPDQLKRLILSSVGLFKNAVGKKILFLNMIESDEDRESMNRLCELMAGASENFPDKIVYGSLLKEEYGIWKGSDIK